MNVQTIELAGRRFVILPEEEFNTLQQLAQSVGSAPLASPKSPSKFAVIQPLRVSGMPASEMLLRDRR